MDRTARKDVDVEVNGITKTVTVPSGATIVRLRAIEAAEHTATTRVEPDASQGHLGATVAEFHERVEPLVEKGSIRITDDGTLVWQGEVVRRLRSPGVRRRGPSGLWVVQE